MQSKTDRKNPQDRFVKKLHYPSPQSSRFKAKRDIIFVSEGQDSRSDPRTLRMAMKKEKNPYYSIVIPIHNEEESIIPLFAKIVEAMDTQEADYEIVFVDDASTDGSPALL